jgi:hypothetical protein
MRRTFLLIGWMLLLGVAGSVVSPMHASAADVSHFRFTAEGVTGDFSPDCPPLYVFPIADLTCTDYFVIAASEADVVGGGSIAPPSVPAPFMYVEIDRLTVHPDLSVESTNLSSGFAKGGGVDVTIDKQHLGSASASAIVSFSDGTTRAVSARWIGYGPRFVFGADGPALVNDGLPFHLHDRCITANNHYHQKFVNARATATFDGISFPMIEQSVPFSTGLFDSVAGIFDNRGEFVSATPASCT